MEDLFEDEVVEQEAEAPAVEQEASEEPAEAQPEEQKGEEVSATPADEPIEEGAAPQDKTVPLGALKDERRKRQEAESERQELQKQVAFLQGQFQAFQSQQPSHQQDLEAKADKIRDDYYTDPVGTVEKIIEERVGKVSADRVQDRINLSEALVKRQYDDYDDVVGVFVDAAKNNPALAVQMRDDVNPALFAYEYGKKIRDVSQYSTIDEMREKLRAEVMAELEAKQKSQQSLSAAAGMSKTNAGARSSTPTANGLMSADDVFAGLGKGILS